MEGVQGGGRSSRFSIIVSLAHLVKLVGIPGSVVGGEGAGVSGGQNSEGGLGEAQFAQVVAGLLVEVAGGLGPLVGILHLTQAPPCGCGLAAGGCGAGSIT